ncbi:MAG: NAD(+) synthase [Clostridia bacterium]|nr:NAD(+) synthase [Clostridia bacterium]
MDYYRLSACSPRLRVGDTHFNVAEIVTSLKASEAEGAVLCAFPELSLTGYTCGDLFFNTALLDAARVALIELAHATAQSSTIAMVGLPIAYESRLYNCAAVVQHGAILGIVPKSVLPTYREFYENRWFSSGEDIVASELQWPEIVQPIPFGTDLLFTDQNDFIFGVEICEDLWSIHPPSAELVLAGARLIVNPSAGTEQIGKCDNRRRLVTEHSTRCTCAYILASAGVHESTSDVVFSGHLLVAENGEVVAENARFSRESDLLFADIDLPRLDAIRMSSSSFNKASTHKRFRSIALKQVPSTQTLTYAKLTRKPFIPEPFDLQEIVQIQCAGLIKRIEHTHSEKIIIGVSGGLDSTLALLVAYESCRAMKQPASMIHAISMPGFGTSSQTRNNAKEICEALQVSFEEIDIRPLCKAQFEAIRFDPENKTTVYENVQARVRTEILMNFANAERGIVLGTGDLSEIALGWNTYSGDHLSMYAINASLPKTLIQSVVSAYAQQSDNAALAEILTDVVATPISPELLPPEESGAIAQKTEDLIGPYELHDFYLWHFVRDGASYDKLRFLALHVFRDVYPQAVIEKTLATFMRRFFSQQFKRNCVPDGPKVTSIALSPRGDWRMPSDMSAYHFVPPTP